MVAKFNVIKFKLLLQGFRHPTPTTVSRTSRVLTMLLGIIAKPLRRDKFEVTSDSVAYLTGNIYFYQHKKKQYLLHIPNLTALVAVSEEVRSRCHVKHTLPRWPVDLNNSEICDSSNQMGILLSRRQKSWDILDQSAITYARTHKTPPHQVTQIFSITFVYFEILCKFPQQVRKVV